MRMSDGSSDVCASDLLGLILAADDADHFIEVEKRDQQAVEQMQAALDLAQPMAQAAAHGVDAKAQPFAEQQLEVLDLRPAIEADHIEVDPVALFQVGGGEQMPHQLLDINPVRARHQHQPHRRSEVHTSELQSTMRTKYS